jgi:type II secretory pathway pseudopilin PulG
MKFAIATSKESANGRNAAFTLAEVLAAMMFMAIVIPVAVEALHIASVSGQVAVRKAEATRVADRILNESIVTTNWTQYTAGIVTENGREFHWTLRNEYWSPDSALQLLTAEVEFSAQGRTYAVRMNTLVNAASTGLAAGGMP